MEYGAAWWRVWIDWDDEAVPVILDHVLVGQG